MGGWFGVTNTWPRKCNRPHFLWLHQAPLTPENNALIALQIAITSVGQL